MDRTLQSASRHAGRWRAGRNTSPQWWRRSEPEWRAGPEKRGRISLCLLQHGGALCNVREQTATGLLESPSTGEEENAESDKAQGTAKFIEDVAEVKPRNGDAKGDYAEVDEPAARCSY